MQEIIGKYSVNVFKNINKDNLSKILIFLEKNNCDYIEDILTDYLDIFMIEYEVFIEKYNIINKKYNNCFIKLASEDMNLFEEFFDYLEY